MFDPETPREAMNFFEGFLFDIAEGFVNWLTGSFTSESITAGLNDFIAKLSDIFGERNVAYAFTDLIDFVVRIVQQFI
ncbi:MAG: hypothetical protein LBC83_01155 [Oscillospiraceae bacterium]|jgi:hypothetical protein|nr:hypothetical protein [Oscillospiraceae bacterium]